MSYKASLILFVLFMAAGLGGYLAVKNGYYPVAVVDLDVITAHSFQNNFLAASQYFQNALASAGKDPHQLDAPDSQKEIKRGVLDKLIIDSLILKELKIETGSEYRGIAENKINNFLKDNKNMEEGAKLLYGLEFSDFKERVLFPQAYREILEGRLYLNNEKLDDWLNKERAAAKVWILLPDLQWKNNQVKLSD